MNIIKKISIILTSLLISISSAQAETWNMALAYGAGNFHSQNAAEFAKAVTEKSGGKLTIKTHPGGSLFKGNNGTVGSASNIGYIFRVNTTTLSTNTSINTTENASAAGPITIAASTVLTVNGHLSIL